MNIVLTSYAPMYNIGVMSPDKGWAHKEQDYTFRNLQAGAVTDVGKMRTSNEDRFFMGQVGSAGKFSLYIVADGIGGHAHGEDGAKTAIVALKAGVAKFLDEGNNPSEALYKGLIEVGKAQDIYNQTTDNNTGATLSAALTNGETAYVTRVGDARAYRYGDEGRYFETIFLDESYVVENLHLQDTQIYTHPVRGIITNGTHDLELEGKGGIRQPYANITEGERDVPARIREIDMATTTGLILASDGMWEPFGDKLIKDFGIHSTRRIENDITETERQATSSQEAAQKLVARSIEYGGPDNVTVIVIRNTDHAQNRQQ